MELGKSKLRRNGMNNLLNALHPHHGLIWTDGRGIFLAPVHLYRDQVEKAVSLRLGEFEYVQSVHWGSSADHDACYMAAVHQHNVTVWHVSGAVPRLAFKQVRKINVQPIPQGCLWNPKSDVLCLLSRQQCSFYFRHSQNRGSFAFPSLEHEKISCGCWSLDGRRLVICVGSALLIYTWNDLQANISEFVTAAWRIPGLSGSLTAIVPAAKNSLVCASDLPLDALCKNNNTDAFVLPETAGGQQGPSDIVRPQGAKSVKDGLLNLQPHPKVQDTAMLNLVQLRSGLQDPTVVASTGVPGLLSPDILHFQVESQCVVVGSNTQSGLQVFALLDNRLLSTGLMTLEKDQRPKGICGVHTSQVTGAYGVLVLVGTAEPTDATFPSGNNTASFALSLQFLPTRPEKARQLFNGHAANAKSASSASLLKSESLREPKIKTVSDSHLHTRQASYKGERPDHRLRSPERGNSGDSQYRVSLARINSGEVHPKLIEEIMDSPVSLVEEVDGSKCKPSPEDLETERVDFSQSTPQFHNSKLSQQYEMNHNGQASSRPNSQSAGPAPSSLQNSDAASRTRERTAETVPNGHSSVDKSARTFQTSNSPDQSSVTAADTGMCQQKTSGPYLSAAVAQRGEKPSGDDGRGGKPSEDDGRGGKPSEDDGRGGKPSADDVSSVCSSFNSSDSNYEVLEKQIQTQREQIDALKKKLTDLSVMVEDTACVFPVRYQNISEPAEAVTIHCVVGGARVSRKFLLDNGRLQLDPIKHAFGLLTVELILDGEPVVLGANVDGYIPMKFSSGSVLQVTGIPVAYSPQLVHKLRSKEAAKP